VFDKIAKADKVSKMDITCGVGDKSDIEVRVNNEWKKINVKTSSYAPFRSGLNLYVKEEEINKDIDAYVQCFVHLNEDDLPPHVHIAGWIPTTSDNWKKASSNLIKIPRTNGHKGVKIGVESLQTLDKMINIIDNKF